MTPVVCIKFEKNLDGDLVLSPLAVVSWILSLVPLKIQVSRAAERV
jgi:hypothetical protein